MVKPVRVSDRGAARWTRGHPWIYRSDVMDEIAAPGVVPVIDPRGRFLGQALASPRSEIRLRLLERREIPVDGAWWQERLTAALARREGIDANAWRLVHGEGDGLPSLVVDRYDRWIVVADPVRRARDDAGRHRRGAGGRCSRPRASCSATTWESGNRRGWPRKSCWCTGPSPNRSRCERAPFATWRRRGTGRRPAPSSTSANTGCSPRGWRALAALRSTVLPTTDRSRCTWRREPDASSRWTRAARRSRAAPRTPC